MSTKDTNLSLAYTKLSHSTLWMAAIMNSCIVLLVAPLIIYYLIKFNARKNEIFFLKRYPKLVIYTNVPFVIAIMIYYPMNSIRKLSPLLLSHPDSYNLSQHVSTPIISFISYYSQWLYLSRFWLMFFDLNYAKSNMNKKWNVHLDPTLIDKDFWLKYKQNLGSQPFIVKLACCGIILLTFCEIILNISGLVHATKTNSVISIFYLLLAITFSFLFIKSPQIFDLLDIRKELKLFLFVIMSGIILNAIGLIFKYSSNPTVSLLAMLWSMNVTLFAGYSLVLVSTWYILKRCNYINKFGKKYALHIKSQKAKELERVLLDSTNFELFVHHLIREFCTETILSFIEMVQFKHLINNKFNLNFGKFRSRNCGHSHSADEHEDDQKENNGTELLFNFESCDIMRNEAIPKSFIVYKSDHTQRDVNDIEPFLQIIKKLYNKYIREGEELEINISGQLRKQYMNDMINLERMKDGGNGDRMEAIDLFEFFDPVIEEMYHLLTATCDRFLESDPNVNIARIHLTDLNTNQIENTLAGIT